MDTKKIARQAALIEDNMDALKWLQDIGGPGEVQYSITIHTFIGEGVAGWGRARTILQDMVERDMARYVAEAREKCMRDIETARAIIEEEVRS